MNARKEVYNKTSTKLHELEFFAWIDLYKGQLNSNQDHPTGFPCAFISVGNIEYQNMTNGIREGKTLVEIYLFFEKGGDTFFTAKDKETSLSILDIVSSVADNLEHLEGECFTSFELTNESDLTERYQRPAYKISYTTLIYNLNTTFGYVPN